VAKVSVTSKGLKSTRVKLKIEKFTILPSILSGMLAQIIVLKE
jgi:hypothetical protein